VRLSEDDIKVFCVGEADNYAVRAVSPTVIDRLTAETDWSIESLKGRDRFETAALINAKVFGGDRQYAGR
jgi:hypothetical protein